jgi:transposase-like protein
MWDDRRTDRNETKETTPPSACPACRSSDITTANKTVTAETYWRCLACGEVWNVARREANRPSPYGSFRR